MPYPPVRLKVQWSILQIAVVRLPLVIIDSLADPLNVKLVTLVFKVACGDKSNFPATVNPLPSSVMLLLDGIVTVPVLHPAVVHVSVSPLEAAVMALLTVVAEEQLTFVVAAKDVHGNRIASRTIRYFLIGLP
jgi:hypothetical protein